MFRWGGAVSSGVFKKYDYSDVVASIAWPLIAVLVFVCAFIHTPMLCASPPTGDDYASSGGDTNGDGVVDIGDAIYLLAHLFNGGDAPASCPSVGINCPNPGGDANGDDVADIADTIWILAYLFDDGPEPAACPSMEPTENPEIPAVFVSEGTNAQGYEEFLHPSTGILFVKIPSAAFSMGTTSELDAPFSPGVDESPVHSVTLNAFLIAKTEITQQQYASVVGSNPSAHVGDDLPVEQVTWNTLHDPGGFLELTGLSLPTEAQWEYACRGGTMGPFGGTGVLDEMGAYQDNSKGETSQVAQFNPNGFGLHDMHGNIWEWVEDYYSADFYGDPCASDLDPLNGNGVLERVVRGGAYNSGATTCRSANRYFLIPLGLTNDSVGFRVAYTLD